MLCNTLVHAPDMQAAIMASSSHGENPSLFDDLMVPPTCEEMLELFLFFLLIHSHIIHVRSTNEDQLLP